ncbi:Tripeptidyl aminopeptidase [Thalassocella blandensis]|nr:Tripeptidyl aminopeptidase [Thalassocella blandensis]
MMSKNSRAYIFRSLTFLAGLAATSLTTFATASAAESQQTLTLKKCEREKGKAFTFGSQCGQISIAEDPANPNGRMIDINVLRIPSIRKSEKAPIFFIAGGPGQASTDLAPMMRTNLSSLLTEHDFVFVDQRGTGKSHPLNCDIDDKGFFNIDPSEFQAQHKSQLQNCVNQLDADFQFYTTPYAVKDLEAVRQALGYNNINIWGGSYGTRVVLEYQRSYPEMIAHAVLDGVAPISIELPRHANADASRALEKVFEACAKDPACHHAFGDLTSRWLTLLAQLREKPVTVALQHPRTLEKVDVFLSDKTLTAQVRLSLYNREASTLLPLAIDKALKGDFSVISSFVFIGYDSMVDSVSEVLHMAVLCNEDRIYAQHATPLKPSHAAPLITGVDSDEFFELCSIFPTFAMPPDYFTPLNSEVPSLLLSGEFDPVTPPLWGERTAAQIKNSQHIVAPGGHHIVTPLGCIPDLIQQFFEDKSLPLDAQCVQDIKAKPFFIDSAGPALNIQTDPLTTQQEPELSQSKPQESAQQVKEKEIDHRD